MRGPKLVERPLTQEERCLRLIGNVRGEEAAHILIVHFLNDYLCLSLGMGSHAAKAKQLLRSGKWLSKADIMSHVEERERAGKPVSTHCLTAIFFPVVVAPLQSPVFDKVINKPVRARAAIDRTGLTAPLLT
jgi:hypothetical protein